jgi:translation initiation factor IF-2
MISNYGDDASPAPNELLVSEHPSVQELAALMKRKPFTLIGDLMEMGVFANVTQPLDFEVVSQLARKHGFTAKRRS